MSKNGKRLAIGTLVAAAAGYVAGILTAPKAGKETRKDIKDTAVRTKTAAEKKLKEVHSELSELIDEGTSKAKSLKTSANDELQKALKTAGAAKDKARVLLSALHDGDAKDKDLKKALDEGSKAVAHLKTYLKNG